MLVKGKLIVDRHPEQFVRVYLTKLRREECSIFFINRFPVTSIDFVSDSFIKTRPVTLS